MSTLHETKRQDAPPADAGSSANDVKIDKQPVAVEIVKRHVGYAAIAGLLPMPVVNAAAVAGVAIKMLRDLSTHYEVEFRQDRVKSIATALVGGALSTELGVGAAGMAKGVPLVGGLVGVIAVPAFAGATTYAIGKVFIQHFESGGTFLDFEPTKVKEYFKQQFQGAKTATA